MSTDTTGRPNQRRRTRKDLLEAAARLMKQGRKPTLEEVAAEALVSRATAYRYFPTIEALHLEAALDVDTPDAEEVLRNAPADAVARLQRVDAALDAMIRANEAPLRMMLVHSLERVVRGDVGAPPRQNRRTPLIEAAIAPVRGQFDPKHLQSLVRALSLVLGTEAMIVFKDVLQLSDAEAAKVKRFAIRALVEGAMKRVARK